MSGAGGTIGSALLDELRSAGRQTRAAYHSASAADAARTAGHDAMAADLVGPEALSYHEVADVLSRVLDRKIEFVPLSDEQARAGMLARGVPEYHVDCPIEVSRAYRYGGVAETTPAVEEITGRAPLDFERFVRDHEPVFR